MLRTCRLALPTRNANRQNLKRTANAPVRVRELPTGPPKFNLLFVFMYAIETFHHFPEIDFSSKNVERANKTRARAKIPKSKYQSFSTRIFFLDLSLSQPETICIILKLTAFHQNRSTGSREIFIKGIKFFVSYSPISK